MRKLIWLLLYLVPVTGHCQYFHHLYTYDTTAEYGRNILLLPDQSLLVPGGYLGLNTNHEDACWFHVTAGGDSVLSRHAIHFDAHAFYMDYSHNAKQLPNGQFVLPYTLHFYANDQARWFNTATLVFLDTQLDTISVRRYTDTSLHSEGLYDCAIFPDASYLLAGWNTSSFTAQQNANTINGLLLRLNAQGDTLWRKVYHKEPNHRSEIQSVQFLDINRSLVGGFSIDVVPIGTYQYLRYKPWFLIIDNTNGNILRDTMYATGYAYPGVVYKDINGGYFHHGRKDSVVVQNFNSIENFPAYLAHLDTNFNIEWITSLPYSYQPYLKSTWSIKQLQNGDYVISGAGEPSSGIPQGWVARINSSGSILWSKYYYSQINKASYLSDFVERPDGNIILCGWTRNDTLPSWRGQDLWLLGLYASGEVLTGTAFTGNASVRTMEFSIYPNPASGSFYLEVPEPGEAELYDMSGKQVATYTVPTKGKTQLLLDNKIAAGNYLLQFTGRESGMVAGKQLIKN